MVSTRTITCKSSFTLAVQAQDSVLVVLSKQIVAIHENKLRHFTWFLIVWSRSQRCAHLLYTGLLVLYDVC